MEDLSERGLAAPFGGFQPASVKLLLWSDVLGWLEHEILLSALSLSASVTTCDQALSDRATRST